MAKLHKEASGFTQVKNEVLVDSKLSWKAKGIFAYLFSKPDDWDFSSDRIAVDSSEGRKTVLSALKELETSGYLSRTKKGSGRVDYYLAYSKNPKSPKGTVPKGLRAQTDTISNTDSESNTKEKVTPLSDSLESLDIAEIIDLFKKVNPSHSRLFANKTQRAAVLRLLKQWPRPKLDNIVLLLAQTNGKPYYPTITTPIELENKMGSLIAQIQKDRTKKVATKNRVIL